MIYIAPIIMLCAFKWWRWESQYIRSDLDFARRRANIRTWWNISWKKKEYQITEITMRRGWKENNENEKVQDEELATEEESQEDRHFNTAYTVFSKEEEKWFLKVPMRQPWV